MRSGQYEEIDLPSIQLKRETWRGEKPGPTTAKDAKDDENPYESIEAVKAKYGSVDKSAKTNSVLISSAITNSLNVYYFSNAL